MPTTTIRSVIWARAAGRCQYPSCNTSLIGDLISGAEDANFGFIAHIVAATPTGPRGDIVRSHLLENDPANLMLLCYTHHKLIDVDDVPGHPESRLLTLKSEHEDRIRIVTEIHADQASHVLRYGAKVGDHTSPVAFDRCRIAMLPERYPADGRSIAIQILGTTGSDHEDEFWRIENDNLERQFERTVRERIADGEIKRLAVFALAPIPLLVKLGVLLGDITPAEIYQLHREPAGWSWARDESRVSYSTARPHQIHPKVALVIAISATIADDRIEAVLGKDVSIWRITAENPHNDIVRNPADLASFRQMARTVLSEINGCHSGSPTIHVFPAVPVSIAVELGRIRMPKADSPQVIYDETRSRGFVARLRIE